MKIDVFNDKYLLRPDKVYFLRDVAAPLRHHFIVIVLLKFL